MKIKEISILGARLHPLTMGQTIDFIKERIEHSVFTQHVVVNVAKVVNMQSDVELRSSVNNCDLINVDGMGVVYGARFLGFDIPERVAGVDLFLELVKLASAEAYPIYLLGAKSSVVEKVAGQLRDEQPGLKIAGYHHGYFWEDEQKIVEEIQNSGARLLFVAISSPMKENFIDRWKSELNVDFVMGVGGSFDVVAGEVKRAPLWMQRIGLEWFYRLAQEPKRLWKRYLLTNMVFLLLLLRNKMTSK